MKLKEKLARAIADNTKLIEANYDLEHRVKALEKENTNLSLYNIDLDLARIRNRWRGGVKRNAQHPVQR